jgi:hypothetical protein
MFFKKKIIKAWTAWMRERKSLIIQDDHIQQRIAGVSLRQEI